MLIGACYVDLSEADADFQALKQWYVDLGTPCGFDAVTIGRKTSGEVRFHRESECPPESTATQPAARSLAAGLAAALFPSVAADVPVGRLAEREIVATVAGVIVIALGRTGLRDFGTHLDSSPAGLMAAAPADQRDEILAMLTHARSTIAQSTTVAAERIAQMTERLEAAASRRLLRTS